MTPEQRREIKARIKKRMQELRITITQLEETSKPVSLDQPIGRLSRMDSMANQAISGQRLTDSKRTLMRLERALDRVDDEHFGICAECGEDIAAGRLLIMPEATLCVDCAE
ncbi:MAG: conjugal transfer protein TraR [Deltaproteobacteria bacterium HGW-Deltaproteobacteria-18]|jgi:DnaK suppressor protein|nr:MAG: conjugal transfer protein TraR [Deltaproteobacteria bacterium HGW-Deltaproteobacteria-18]